MFVFSFLSKQVIEKAAGFTALPEQFYQAMATVLLLIIMFIKELKNLAAVSMFANILCFTGLVIILQYCVRGLAPISSFPAFSSWAQLPLYFGTAVYAFEGIGVVSIFFMVREFWNFPENCEKCLGKSINAKVFKVFIVH